MRELALFDGRANWSSGHLWTVPEFNRVFSQLIALRWILEDQKYLQRLKLLAIVRVAFVLDHEDH